MENHLRHLFCCCLFGNELRHSTFVHKGQAFYLGFRYKDEFSHPSFERELIFWQPNATNKKYSHRKNNFRPSYLMGGKSQET